MNLDSITIALAWGLGNRLRTLASAVIIAKHENVPIKCIWTNCDIGRETTIDALLCFSTGLNISFETDFSFPNDLANEKYVNNFRFLELKPWHQLPVPCVPSVDASIEMLDASERNLLICTYLSFKWPEMTEEVYLANKMEFYKSLKPVPKILAQVEEYYAQFGEYTVGVHMRGTDRANHLHCWMAVEAWEKKMQEAVLQNSKVKFFIATDEIQKKQYLVSKFPDRIINPNSVLPERETLGGQETALAELFTLGRVNYLIGTGRSTFSFEAYHLACAFHNKAIDVFMVDDLSTLDKWVPRTFTLPKTQNI